MSNVIPVKIIGFVLFLTATASCISDRYALLDTGTEKDYLSSYIAGQHRTGKLSRKPLIVVDGESYTYSNLENKKLPIHKSDIAMLQVLEKGSMITRNAYGENGNGGVVIVMTKSQGQISTRISGSKVLYFIGSKMITREELDAIDVSRIQSIEVIKEKANMFKYTLEDCDGIIVINLKK